MSLQQEVIIRDGKIVGSPPIATPSVNKALVTDGNGNIVGSAVSKDTLEELNMLITDDTGQDIADALSALINAVKPSASDIPYDSSLSVKGKIDEKVNKDGDTMTGDLTVKKGSPRFNADNNAVTLSSATDNGVSSTTYCGFSIRDSNQAQIGLLENVAGTDGTISTRINARNINTSGNAVSNSIQVIARKNGTIGYSVSDSEAFRSAIEISAVHTPYSNNTSGLTANNVQGAIDEVCNDLIITKTYTTSYTAGGNASISITASDFNATTPNGYTPIGISDFASQNTNVTVRGIYGRATGTSAMMALRNISSTSVTATAYITILYIKTLFL